MARPEVSAAPICAQDLRILLRTIVLAVWHAVSDSRDGRLNILKAGELVAGATWTHYMITESPDSLDMWLAYSIVIGARGLMHYMLKTGKLENLWGRAPRNDCEPQ